MKAEHFALERFAMTQPAAETRNDAQPDPPVSDAARESRLLANLEQVEAKLEAAYSAIESRRDELDRRERELEQRIRQAAVRESRTRLQRKRVAEELRARKAEADLGGSNAAGGAADSKSLIAAEQANEQLRRELRLQRDLADEAIREASSMRERLADSRPNDDIVCELRDELQRLMAERDHAVEELDAARKGATEEQLREDQRRLADELNRLEDENSELSSEVERLQQELELLRASHGSEAADEPPEEDPLSGFDWEAQKKLLLENLDENATAKVQPELKSLQRVAEVAMTGMAADPNEVQELRDQLNMLIAAVASTSGETVEGVDYMTVLEQEREKLDALQQQWHDKLRESELEISVERAKLARERVKLEEDLRVIEAEKSRLTKPQDNETAEPATRNRWLARLGLSDDQES